MPGNIVIVDYGMGNLRSVLKKFEQIKIPAVISSDHHVVAKADKLILPGVGHFSAGMNSLAAYNLLDSLHESVLIKNKPILGICLGLQLFANHSEEGNCNGLGWIDADVCRFRVSDKLKYKIPHIGWNTVDIIKESPIIKGIDNHSSFYFVHSYHIICQQKQDVLTLTEYDYNFASSIEKGNIFGTQFHPEKSHDIGEKLLKNFADL